MKKSKKRGIPTEQAPEEASKETMKESLNLDKKRLVQQKLSFRDVVKSGNDNLPNISNLSVEDNSKNGQKLEKTQNPMTHHVIRVPGVHYGKAQYANFDDFKNKTGQKQVRIYSWNVNGFNAVIKKKDFQEFLSATDPDILCLNETKMDAEKLVKTALWQEIPKCYEQYWNCSKDKKGYSGVAIYTKIAPISVQQDIQINKHDREGRVITMEFAEFILIACYTVNSGEALKRVNYRVDEWDVDFFKFIAKLEEKQKPVILSGDLNCAHEVIDIYDPAGKEKIPGFSPQERKSFGDFLERQDFVDTFRHFYPTKMQYTFWSLRQNLRKYNKGWRIDYFLINRAYMRHVHDSLIHDQYVGSDHCPIELKFNLEPVESGSTEPVNQAQEVEDENGQMTQMEADQVDKTNQDTEHKNEIQNEPTSQNQPIEHQNRPQLFVNKLKEGALLPVNGSTFAAGYDLHALEAASVPARGKAIVGTGIALAIPEGNYGRIAPRSGLAAKHSIDVGAGVIDSDYRGEIKVLLFNLSDTDFEIKPQDRIAQLIIEKYTRTEIVEVDGELDETVRGHGGFGSTGTNALQNGKSQNEKTQ